MKGTRGKPNEQPFPNTWSFSYLQFTKYVTNIIAEPKYKYGQQEQITVRNRNRSNALEVDKRTMVKPYAQHTPIYSIE